MKIKTFTALTLFVLSILGCGLLSARAQTRLGWPILHGPSLSLAGLPNADIYALDNDNTLWLRVGCSGRSFTRQFNIRNVDSQVVGIDFRPADGRLYAVTAKGSVYRIETATGRATLVSSLTVKFAGGAQSLVDFNPVANALRLIGSNDQNLGVVNSAGDLNLTATQTQIAYAQGDVNGPVLAADGTVIRPGADPNLVGGSYTNNFNGATTTIFYALDFNLNTLVTIAGPLVGQGSSNTASGRLQTIGNLIDTSGQPVDITPTTDIDIYTVNNNNFAVGVSGRTIFTIDLSQIETNLQLGVTQPVTVRKATLMEAGFIDLAISQRSCGRN